VKAGEIIPPRSLVVGNPGKIIKQVDDAMLEWKSMGTALYQQLPASMHAEWEPCEPLTEVEDRGLKVEVLYETWNQLKNKK
jgi:hypothetical protein